MARILIGNIKGPKGDTGAQGPQGATGPQGPQGPLPPLVNNALATEAGVAALDAVMGKTLQEQITNNKNDITELNSNIKWGTKIIYSVTVGANQEVSASFPASDFGLTTKPRAGFISVSNANCLIPIGYDYDNSTNEEIKFRLRSVTEINNMTIRASVLLLV